MWKTVKLGDVCKIVNGGTPKSNVKEYWEGDIQWLTPKDMGKIDGKYVDLTERQITKDGLNNSSAKLIPANSVILSCRAPIGHVFINTIEMSFNQGCKGLVPTEDIRTDYLYYFLFASKQLLNDLGTGTTFKEISGKTLANVELLLPPLAEQQRIVAKLDAAFVEIDKAIALAKETETIASKVGAASIKGALANEYFEWQTSALGTIAENLDAKRVPITKSKRVEGVVPYYGASGIVDYVDGHLFDEELLLISEDGANLLMRTYPIAFSVSGKTWVNNHAHVLRFSDRNIQKWVERYLNVTDLTPFISGMAQPKLNQKKLNSIQIPLPNEKYMNELLDMIEITKKNSEELVRLQYEKTMHLVQLKSVILTQELNPSEAA